MDNFKHFLPANLVDSRYNSPVNILLVGAGGNGGPMITGLARMDFALRALGHPGLNLTVCDGDAVGPENVGRQLFSPSDVGRNKAVTLVSRVNMFFGLKWRAFPTHLAPTSLLPNQNIPSLIITAVDKVKPREYVYGLVKGRSVYWLDMGNTKDTGQIILGTGAPIAQPKGDNCIAHLPTVLDLWPNMKDEETKEYQGPSCGVAQALEKQDLFINTTVSTWALDLLWEGFRKGYLTENGVFTNLKTKRSTPLVINPDTYKTMGWAPKVKKQRAKKDRTKKAA
jgi:PRTRC genetic system ThiF family protein